MNTLIEDGAKRGILPPDGGVLVAVTDGAHLLEATAKLESVEHDKETGNGVLSAEIDITFERVPERQGK